MIRYSQQISELIRRWPLDYVPVILVERGVIRIPTGLYVSREVAIPFVGSNKSVILIVHPKYFLNHYSSPDPQQIRLRAFGVDLPRTNTFADEKFFAWLKKELEIGKVTALKRKEERLIATVDYKKMIDNGDDISHIIKKDDEYYIIEEVLLFFDANPLRRNKAA